MINKKQPLVSIVTPVYNGEKYLAECIESVLQQTYNNWDFTIVDNCSKDRTLAIAENYAKKDNRIRIHKNENFVDITENHNIAFSLISDNSEYCKNLSSDDWLFPDCIAKMVEFADANPSVGIAVCYGISDQRANYIGLPTKNTVMNGRVVCRSQLLGRPYVFGSPTSTLYRTDLIKKNRKKFYKKTTPHHDIAACYEYLKECDFGFVHQILVYERVHEEQISAECQKLFTWAPTQLSFLKEYGPIYLKKEEINRRLGEIMEFYYNYLAISVIRKKNKEFWKYHKVQLKSLGYSLDRLKITKIIFSKLIEAIKRPRQTAELILMDRPYYTKISKGLAIV